MKRIKLNAYFSKNLGDDLMIHTLLNRYPQYTFWSDWNTPACDIFLKYPNFQNYTVICKRWGKLARILHILTFGKLGYAFPNMLRQKQTRSCGASVTIGGSMFIEQDNCCIQEQIAREKQNLCIPPRFIMGANFGPYHTEEFKEAYSEFFSTCQGVTFRDQYSYDLFSQLPCVDYAPDVVLSLNVKHLLNRASKNTVVISVMNLSNRGSLCNYAESYCSFIRSLCQSCLKSGKTPVLMSFCESEGDMQAIHQILSGFSEEVHNQIQIFDYQGNLQDALEIIADAEKIIATRFHAMILALLFGKPFYCLSYSDKSKHFLNDLNCNAYCTMDKLATVQPDDVLNHYTTVVDASSSIQEAHRQFYQFERYLSHG